LEANSVTAVQQPHHMGDVMDTKDPFHRMVIISPKLGLVQQMWGNRQLLATLGWTGCYGLPVRRQAFLDRN